MIFTLANDHFIVWLSSVTLTFNLLKQMFQMNNEQLCQIILKSMHKYVQVMSSPSSIYDHYIFWPSIVTLTFNLPEQMFQMNNCARFFFEIHA